MIRDANPIHLSRIVTISMETDGKEQNRPENILIKRNGQNEEFYKMLEEVWQNMHNNVTNMEDVYENKH